MSTKSAEEVWRQIKQYQRKPADERNEYDYRLPILKLLEELFLCDAGYAFEKNADVTFFTVQKESLERLRSQFVKKGPPQTSTEKVNYTNALNQCFCELVELALLMQQKYGFSIDGIPSPFILSSDSLGLENKDRELKQSLRDRFINFVCLRLGDFSRYLLDLTTAKLFYERAVRALPSDGQACNQIGLIEAAEHNFVEALYEHVRAINAGEPFSPAAANIENLYKRYSSVNIDDKRLRYDSLFINFAGACHSLVDMSAAVVQRLSELLSSEKMDLSRLEMHFVILVSIWSNLDSTPDEIKCSDHLALVTVDQFLFLIRGFADGTYNKAKKNKILALIWLYAAWLDDKKTALARKAPKEPGWIEKLARLIDVVESDYSDQNFDSELFHLRSFCPLALYICKTANSSSLLGYLKSIFLRVSRFYRISDVPKDNFLNFFEEHKDLFVERRRERTSHTVPILSSI